MEIVDQLGEYSAAGAKEIIYVIDDKLPPVKDNVLDTVQSQPKKQKIKIIINVKVTGLSTAGGETTVELMAKDGRKQNIRAEVYVT
jgi:hypothetical protein